MGVAAMGVATEAAVTAGLAGLAMEAEAKVAVARAVGAPTTSSPPHPHPHPHPTTPPAVCVSDLVSRAGLNRHLSALDTPRSRHTTVVMGFRCWLVPPPAASVSTASPSSASVHSPSFSRERCAVELSKPACANSSQPCAEVRMPRAHSYCANVAPILLLRAVAETLGSAAIGRAILSVRTVRSNSQTPAAAEIAASHDQSPACLACVISPPMSRRFLCTGSLRRLPTRPRFAATSTACSRRVVRVCGAVPSGRGDL